MQVQGDRMICNISELLDCGALRDTIIYSVLNDVGVIVRKAKLFNSLGIT